MNNLQVIQNFLNKQKGATPKRLIQYGYYTQEGRTLQTDGQTLTNYKTDIAEHNNGVIKLLIDFFSTTTSKIQFEILEQAQKKGYKVELIQTEQNTKRLEQFTSRLYN